LNSRQLPLFVLLLVLDAHLIGKQSLYSRLVDRILEPETEVKAEVTPFCPCPATSRHFARTSTFCFFAIPRQGTVAFSHEFLADRIKAACKETRKCLTIYIMHICAMDLFSVGVSAEEEHLDEVYLHTNSLENDPICTCNL
jgi:hypothetical protein